MNKSSNFALFVNLETSGGLPETTKEISILRSSPISMTIDTRPVLSDANIVKAQVFETVGGYAIAVQFDEPGSYMLEQYTAANLGKHLAIFGKWGKTPDDQRWLSAPLITQRISGGLLSFTPDASKAEAEQFVQGLNDLAKQSQKGMPK